MTVLFIGRFQPFHNGHAYVLDALEGEDVIVGVGSAYESHTLDNPFTCRERMEMILRSDYRPYVMLPIPDINRCSLWVRHVESLVPTFDAVVTNNPRDRALFSEAGYTLTEIPLLNRKELNATEIRRRIATGGAWRHLVPEGTTEVIDSVGAVERIRRLTDSGGG